MITALLDRLDDWLNPIVVKELRQAVKSRMVIGILLLFLGLQLFILGMILLFREARGDTVSVDWNTGNEVFRIQQGILLWTIMILVPAYTAVRMGAERSDQNVDLMFISTLRPASIIWGKFFAASVLGLLIFSTCAPFMTFTYLLRGIDIPTILTVLFIDLLCLFYGVMTALLCSSVPGNRAMKFFFSFIGFMSLIYICSIITMGTVALIMLGGGYFFEWLGDSWASVSVFVLAVLANIALMYFYAVSLISPPSANRILPLRIFVFTVWLVMGAASYLVSYNWPGGVNEVAVTLYTNIITEVLLVQFVISICERDDWGPRITRTIPRFGLVRFLAFLFYTGAAGGILFSALLLGITYIIAAIWVEMFPGMMARALEYTLARHGMFVLYVYCYGMSGVIVRTYLFGDSIRTGYTWLVSALLVGLGSSIPAIFAYVFFSDQLRGNEFAWWMLPNPLSFLMESYPSTSSGGEFREITLWFLGIWATLVSALCLPWFFQQWRRFKPLQVREIEPISAVILDAEAVPTGGVG